MSAPSALSKLTVFSGTVGVGSLGTEQKPWACWRLSSGLVNCTFERAAVCASAGWKFFTGHGSQPPHFNEPFFGCFIVCFTEKAVIPWHLKQYDDRERTPTKQMFLAPLLPSRDTQGEQSKWPEFTAGCRSILLR